MHSDDWFTKFNARQSFPLYGIMIPLTQSCKCIHVYVPITCTVAANKKLTFRVCSTIILMCKCFHFHTVLWYARALQLFLRLHERLIGRRDRTAIIDRSCCRVKETSFWEVLSHGEAQRTLAQTSKHSRSQKKTVLLSLVTCQVRFAWAVRVIASNKKSDRLGFERTTTKKKNGSLSGLAIIQANAGGS